MLSFSNCEFQQWNPLLFAASISDTSFLFLFRQPDEAKNELLEERRKKQQRESEKNFRRVQINKKLSENYPSYVKKLIRDLVRKDVYMKNPIFVGIPLIVAAGNVPAHGKIDSEVRLCKSDGAKTSYLRERSAAIKTLKKGFFKYQPVYGLFFMINLENLR